ncbi:hypothetical protein O3P69_004683 [Scylla paramamosain]|uniref:Peptidase A2 domain-containing protein n=1 Tax=Scylla paramamosain TaxID=85552 RepID=A0AAW0UCT0_SCYPA
MLQYRHSTLMLHPVHVQLAAARHSLSLAEYSGLMDTPIHLWLWHHQTGPGDRRALVQLSAHEPRRTPQRPCPAGDRGQDVPLTFASARHGIHDNPSGLSGSVPATSGSRPCGRARSFRGGGAELSAAICLALPGKHDTQGPLIIPALTASPFPAPAGLPLLLREHLPDSPSPSPPARVRPRHFAQPRGSPHSVRPSPPSRMPEQPSSCQRALLWVKDTCSGARFLVDSGAEVSVVPATEKDRQSQPRTTYDLLAANHTPIATYCTWTLCLGLLPSSRFPWAFVVVDVDHLILGMDFLAAYNLLMDPHNGW